MCIQPQPCLIIAVLVLAACGAPGTHDAAVAVDDTTWDGVAPDWTGFYADTVPCADCPGIVERLHLRADSTYVMTDAYLDRDSIPYGRMGGWSVNGDTLILRTGGDARLWVTGGNRLDPLDREGKPLAGPLSRSIARVDSFTYGPMHLNGGYVYYADAHSFKPEGSRYAFPVAADSTSAQLEERYRTQVKDPPAPLDVAITAVLRSGPAMEGDGTEEYIHVLRVDKGR